MQSTTDPVLRWLSIRVRIACGVALVVTTLLPPYIPKAALAPDEATPTTQQFLLVEEGFLMKSSSLTKQGSRRAYAEGLYHTVKEGESLEKISARYGISKETIILANKLGEGVPIRPGQNLLILPVDGVLHTVGRGQTLLGIAELYDIPAEEIAAQNNLEGGFILANQELIIPGGKPLVTKPTQVAQQPKPQPAAPKPGQPAAPATATRPAQFVEEEAATAGLLQKPCSSDCSITQYFHSGHFALDMQDKGGGPVYAAEAGTVIRADIGWNGGYGNVIEIDHGNELVTLYGHNKTLLVKVGDTVERGQQIADMGNTGLVYGKTGIHVHFEVQLRGVKKNPLLYIQ